MMSPTDNEESHPIAMEGVTLNDASTEDLISRITILEQEKKDLSEKFDAQRGKLQRLFLNKEEETKKLNEEIEKLTQELNEVKSELVVAGLMKENEMEQEKRKAQEEIATLNQLVHDTVDVSNTSQEELKRLRNIIKMLEAEVQELKEDKDKEVPTLLSGTTSNVISVTKNIARKVVGQLGSDSDSRAQDNLEDSMRKVKRYAQEDAEVLRSLVVPLEEEIQALKDKLRSTDERLRKYEPCKEDERPSTPSPVKSVSCDMCSNYEAQLVTQQQECAQLQRQKETLESNMERFREDVVKETEFRKEMELKWNEKKEEYKAEVGELKKQYAELQEELRDLQSSFASVLQDTRQHISSLAIDRKKLSAEMKELQDENDKLVGKYTAHSDELRSEVIDLPTEVDELHELVLKLKEDLIAAIVAKEAKEDSEKTLKCKIKLLMDQIDSELSARSEMENSLASENTILKKQLEGKEKERSKLHTLSESLKKSEMECRLQLKTKETELSELLERRKRLESTVNELRSRVSSLQQELDNGEAVQKDFVRLSQSLQMELEKIRAADTEVRWQHDDDVDDCPGCRVTFTSSKKKIHCRHCGKIFCIACLPHTVRSGPQQRPSQVCQVCHTLLNRETAPYFSQDPPHSPN